MYIIHTYIYKIIHILDNKGLSIRGLVSMATTAACAEQKKTIALM